MTALAKERMETTERWKFRQFTLTGAKGWKNGAAALVLSGATKGKVVPASGAANQFVIGKFAETVDATAADKSVNVELPRELEIEWWVNGSAGDAIAATDVGQIAYIKDDNTVTILPNGSSPMGRIWGFDATKGVAVERLQSPTLGLLAVLTAPAAFAANDLVVPSNPVSGSVLDIPATAAASTVTLPAAAREGTTMMFFADGTKNGHTVQYRDATGPVNLTAALTASKRHLAIATFLGGKWAVTATVAP